MPYELENRLVIGVVSSAVFDLVASDAAFQSQGGGVPQISARKPPRPASYCENLLVEEVAIRLEWPSSIRPGLQCSHAYDFEGEIL
jgi:hypothetical protein